MLSSIIMSSDICSLMSFILSILSIFVGIMAILQAKRYNDSSKKINDDTRMLITLQTRVLEDIQKEVVRNNSTTFGKINLKRDEFYLYKLSGFNGKNNDEILEIIKNLRIKNHSYQFVKKFLEDKSRIKTKVDFYNFAETYEGRDIKEVQNELEKYNLFLQIDYQARKYK